MIKNMLNIGDRFQTSVNIAYDINDKQKIAGLIPSQAAIELMESFFLSTDDASTQRARVLVGAYGKGKSHIILTILSMLSQKLYKENPAIYNRILTKAKEYNEDLYNYAVSYMESDKKLLPVIINGSSISLVQAFISGLYQALNINNLGNILPETHFQAAVRTIGLWKTQYSDTYEQFKQKLNVPVADFIEKLNEFDVDTYAEFEVLYPTLTSGSIFNPFSGFDVVELYEKVNDKLVELGYNGIYVVYDEFSKYLESSITKATVSDTKMLQDFAEKCNRSGSKQLHLLLICHKEIANYIDNLPKNKVDGWRGVSERFNHVVLESDFSQIYEIMGTAIAKKAEEWKEYKVVNQKRFAELTAKYVVSKLYEECNEDTLKHAIVECYPLHPITTFVLPRLSEAVAQNERTMFTFIAGQEKNTLQSVLEKNNEDFPLVTIDVLYDYFAAQLRNQPYTSDIYKYYKLSASILKDVDLKGLPEKIIKAVTVIYCLEQFERIAPTVDTVINLFSEAGYSLDEIEDAVDYLIRNKFVIYLKRSNAYLQLKERTGVDVSLAIQDAIVRGQANVSVKEILNSLNIQSCVYPTSYNDAVEMTRYFKFTFIDAVDFCAISDWNRYTDAFDADGVVFAVLVNNEEELSTVTEIIKTNTTVVNRAVFVLPVQIEKIADVAQELAAVSKLRELYVEDSVVHEEYDMIYTDLTEVISVFINKYLHPEQGKATYYYRGERRQLFRKAHFSNLLSLICAEIYPLTPIINNEVLNKNSVSGVAKTSRIKLVNAVLNNGNVVNLGLTGSGQDVSFMRSTLVVPGILKQNENEVEYNFMPKDHGMKLLLKEIKDFFEASKINYISFTHLYDALLKPEFGFGMRKGVIPVYIALVLNQYKNLAVIKDRYTEVHLTADLLERINDNPQDYEIYINAWDKEKEAFTKEIANLFVDYIYEQEKDFGGFAYLTNAMNRWYLSLPRYVKELKKAYMGSNAFEKVPAQYIKFASTLRLPGIGAQEILFNRLPQCFGQAGFNLKLYADIVDAKKYFDEAKYNLENALIEDTKNIFLNGRSSSGISLTSACLDWLDGVPESKKTVLYPNGAEKLFGIIASLANDEHELVNRLAPILVSLRLNDWNSDTVEKYNKKLLEYVNTIQNYVVKETKQQIAVSESNSANDEYTISFATDDGSKDIKTFKKIEYSKRAKLLYTNIVSDIEEMGQSISDQEKRQILMDILKDFC